MTRHGSTTYRSARGAFAVVVLVVACTHDPTRAMPDPTLSTPLGDACRTGAGSVDACVDLGGTFVGSTGAPGSPSSNFDVYLYDATTGTRLTLTRLGAGLPAAGGYRLAPPHGYVADGLFTMTYAEGHGDSARTFISREGGVEILEASSELVRGRFRFAATPGAAWRGPGDTVWTAVDVRAPDGPMRTFGGTFTARRGNYGIGCAGTGGPSVLVEVRDHLGQPAAFGTTIVIQEGAFRDSVDGQRNFGDPFGSGLRVGAGERRVGIYDVRLYRPGYRRVTLTGVRAPGDVRCGYAHPSDIRAVTLELLPDAPPVRAVVVSTDVGLGWPGLRARLLARVDASPGVSAALRWTSSDTTVAKLADPTDSSVVVVSQCRRKEGVATITATSVVRPQSRGTARVTVFATPTSSQGVTGQPKADIEACLAQFARGG